MKLTDKRSVQTAKALERIKAPRTTGGNVIACKAIALLGSENGCMFICSSIQITEMKKMKLGAIFMLSSE